MHVTSLRYRQLSQETWNFLRFPTGTGDLKNLQIIEADSVALKPILEAFRFALLGQITSHPSEVVLQIHDDDGTSWSILRKSGSLRVTRDGEVVDASMAFIHLLKGIGISVEQPIDFDKNKDKLFYPFQLAIASNRVELWPLGENEPPHLGLGRHLQAKIQDHLNLIQKNLESETPVTFQQAVKISELLDPLFSKYSDLDLRGKHWTALQQQASKETSHGSLHDNQQNTHKFAKELSIIAEIQYLVTPLSGPTCPSLSSLEKQKNHLDQQIEATEKVTGALENLRGEVPDFNQAIDILCRLQAYGKLVRSTQNLRDYCETQVEPHLKSYLSQSETMGAQIRCLLESIQADQLKIHHQREILVPKTPKNPESGASRDHGVSGKTWFDRFKAPARPIFQDAVPTPSVENSQSDLMAEPINRIATAVEDVIVKGSSILAELPSQEGQHENLKQSLDESIDQLVQKYSKVRKEWLVLAKTLNLPEALDIVNLIKYVILFERSMVLRERREAVHTKILDFQDRIQRLERLIIQWRKITDSQKPNPLDQPHLVIQEALSITRYLESKIKRFDQVLDQYSHHNIKGQVLEIILAQFTAEKNQLVRDWTEAVQRINLPHFSIHKPYVSEVLQSALHIKQWGHMLEESIATSSRHRPSQSCQSECLVEIWSLASSPSPSPSPSTSISIPQDKIDVQLLVDYAVASRGIASYGSAIILICPYPAVTAKLAALGASVGTLTARQIPVQQQSESQSESQFESRSPKPTPTLQRTTVGPQAPRPLSKQNPVHTGSPESLQARAERVLAMLGPKDQKSGRRT